MVGGAVSGGELYQSCTNMNLLVAFGMTSSEDLVKGIQPGAKVVH